VTSAGTLRLPSPTTALRVILLVVAVGLTACAHHRQAAPPSVASPGQFGARPLVSVADDRPLPADAVANVKTAFGAKGDGRTDDTAAIRRAIASTIGYQQQNSKKILYFPDGIYLVSDRLPWQNTTGGWDTYLTLQGQSRSGTVIRLMDDAPGYSNPSAPRAVIYTASLPANPKTTTVDGSGDRAHNNFILDLTVDTGRGNPGAIGIDYMANNKGAIRDVVIRSGDGAGVAGLSMRRYGPGPCMIADLEVVGFSTGISVAKLDYSVTFDHVTVRHQRISGLTDEDNVLSIRSLRSENSVPAIILTSQYAKPNALLTLLDGRLVGGVPSHSAIEGLGNVFLRDVSVTGYRSVLSNNAAVVPGRSLAEYSSDGYRSSFPGPPVSVNLPVGDEPMFSDAKPTDWADVTAFGAVPSNNKVDDTAAIQAAIDSGKPVVYFPTGTYLVSATIRVHGPVRALLGFESVLEANPRTKAADQFSPTQALLSIESGDGQPVFVRQFQLSVPAGVPAIEDASPSAVVLQDLRLPPTTYRNTRAAGPLYIDDVDGGAWSFDHQVVWARQLNTEATGVKLTNAGGRLWVLGLKTEQPSTVAVSTDGATTEILGGLIYPVGKIADATPAFIGDDSNLFLIYATTAYAPGRNYPTQVQERRGGDVRALATATLPGRGLGSTLPPYVGVARPDLLPRSAP
jgi:hypothetical protein